MGRQQLPPGVTRQDVHLTQDSDGPWCGSCGVMWEFIDGGPKDNETHFAPLRRGPCWLNRLLQRMRRLTTRNYGRTRPYRGRSPGMSC